MRSVVVGLGVVCLGLCVAGKCHSEHMGQPEKQLLYADVIVRGVIESIHTDYVPEAVYWPDSDHPESPLATTTLTLRVHEVLRGAFSPAEIVAVAPGGFPPGVPDTSQAVHSIFGFAFDFPLGQEVVYCLWFIPENGGVYLVPPNEGRFRKSNGSWINEAKPTTRYDINAIRSVVAAADPLRLLEQADLVVEGKVLEITTDLKDAWSPVTETIVLEPQTIWKGTVKKSTIQFDVLRRGGPQMVPVPVLHRGDRYVAFLRKEQETYVPFAGVNGLLQIKGGALIRNNAVEYEMGKDELTRLLDREVRDGN